MSSSTRPTTAATGTPPAGRADARPSLFTRLGRVTVARRRGILVSAVLFVIVAGVLGGGVVARLSSGGFDDPASDSAKAATALTDQFHAGPSDLVLVVGASDATSVDAASVSAAATTLATKLAHEKGVENVASYWTPHASPPAVTPRRPAQASWPRAMRAPTDRSPCTSEAHPSSSTRWAPPSRRTSHGPRASPSP